MHQWRCNCQVTLLSLCICLNVIENHFLFSNYPKKNREVVFKREYTLLTPYRNKVNNTMSNLCIHDSRQLAAVMRSERNPCHQQPFKVHMMNILDGKWLHLWTEKFFFKFSVIHVDFFNVQAGEEDGWWSRARCS